MTRIRRRSGFVDPDLRGVSNLDVPSRDPIDLLDPEEENVSIWKKKLINFLTLPCSTYKSRLCWLRSTCGTTAFKNKSGRELSSHLSELMVSFSRSTAEAAALTDAADFEFPDTLMDADVIKLRELGSFDALIDYHNNDKQKESGLNVERIYANLRTDTNYLMIRELVDDTGVVIDTAADFIPIHRTAKFRIMQV